MVAQWVVQQPHSSRVRSWSWVSVCVEFLYIFPTCLHGFLYSLCLLFPPISRLDKLWMSVWKCVCLVILDHLVLSYSIYIYSFFHNYVFIRSDISSNATSFAYNLLHLLIWTSKMIIFYCSFVSCRQHILFLFDRQYVIWKGLKLMWSFCLRLCPQGNHNSKHKSHACHFLLFL